MTVDEPSNGDRFTMVDHHYVSTACAHRRHYECRRECKFCANPCLCGCHALLEAKS